VYYPGQVRKDLSNTDRGWLKLAIRTASTSQERYKHGAVIVKGGRIVSSAVNRMLLDPFYYADVADKFSVHAEEAAIARIRDVRGAVLYVARVNNLGELRMSKPCPMCAGLIEKHGIKRVVWTEDVV
jgi:tRNA(Arg) A34 adenosine deaminase TadA